MCMLACVSVCMSARCKRWNTVNQADPATTSNALTLLSNTTTPLTQAFAVFLPIKSVGVQGDQRTHNYVLALRAVCSSDGMTADWYPFQPDFMRDVSTRICNKVSELVCVCVCV